LTKGISECLNSSSGLRKEMATSPDFWEILRHLHMLPDVAPHVFSILEELNNSPQNAITADNYENTIRLLDDFATAGSIGSADEQRRDQAIRSGGKQAKLPKPKHRQEVTRGSKAMSMVYGMTARVPLFIQQSHLEPTKAWTAYWSPIFRVLTKQCLNPCREIRTQAFAALRQALLDKNLLTAAPEDRNKEWEAIFDNILFPLIKQLLKPDVYATDPIGMSETRVQAAQLLCRIFLHYLSALNESGRMTELWGKILEVMDRLMHSGQGDTLVRLHGVPLLSVYRH
jgi:brefeldin A-resistance guanine nucleotide exchange factor 1